MPRPQSYPFYVGDTVLAADPALVNDRLWGMGRLLRVACVRESGDDGTIIEIEDPTRPGRSVAFWGWRFKPYEDQKVYDPKLPEWF